ncbi:MAG: uroporphyrinogen decarboxylase [Aquificae bacterium]|nr:uroporphyrinogen decarboxylase [Aquificota bacterium]
MPRNDLILRSIRGEPVERFPVWLMRQAGRYMKEYRLLRARADSFLDLCKNVDLAVEISLLPLRLLGVDAVIIFSDILVPLEALGVQVLFEEGEGPRLLWSGEVSSLKKYDPSQNGYVYEIVRKVKEAQDEVPVIGFSGAPFTLASYMIEGRGSRDFLKTKLFMWEREKEFRKLMEVLTDALLEYLSRQIEAGADLVQIFDSWALYLSAEDYEEYVFPFVNYLIGELKERYDTPVIYFFRGSAAFLDIVSDTRADVLSVDWSVSLPEVMKVYEKAFQGNLEPAVLYAEKEFIRERALSLLRKIPRKSGYIFNLGHGLAPDMDFKKVKLLVDTVRSYYLT